MEFPRYSTNETKILFQTLVRFGKLSKTLKKVTYDPNTKSRGRNNG